MKERVRNHKDICKELTDLYESKNTKYGNSFETTFEEYGPTALLVRLDDKMNRARTLFNNEAIKPGDESVRDTLLDLANYAIMGIMELDKGKAEEVGEEVKEEPKGVSKVEEALSGFTKSELIKVGEGLGVTLPKKSSKASVITRLEKELPEGEILKALEDFENTRVAKEEAAEEEEASPKKNKKK